MGSEDSSSLDDEGKGRRKCYAERLFPHTWNPQEYKLSSLEILQVTVKSNEDSVWRVELLFLTSKA